MKKGLLSESYMLTRGGTLETVLLVAIKCFTLGEGGDDPIFYYMELSYSDTLNSDICLPPVTKNQFQLIVLLNTCACAMKHVCNHKDVEQDNIPQF